MNTYLCKLLANYRSKFTQYRQNIRNVIIEENLPYRHHGTNVLVEVLRSSRFWLACGFHPCSLLVRVLCRVPICPSVHNFVVYVSNNFLIVIIMIYFHIFIYFRLFFIFSRCDISRIYRTLVFKNRPRFLRDSRPCLCATLRPSASNMLYAAFVRVLVGLSFDSIACVFVCVCVRMCVCYVHTQ